MKIKLGKKKVYETSAEFDLATIVTGILTYKALLIIAGFLLSNWFFLWFFASTVFMFVYLTAIHDENK